MRHWAGCGMTGPEVTRGRVPTSAEILLWTDRGATLAALEFARVTDEPTSLPAVVGGRLSWPPTTAVPAFSTYSPTAGKNAT